MIKAGIIFITTNKIIFIDISPIVGFFKGFIFKILSLISIKNIRRMETAWNLDPEDQT